VLLLALDLIAHREMLEKIPAALHRAQATPDPGLKPKQGRAVPAGSGKVEKLAVKFEGLDTDACFTIFWFALIQNQQSKGIPRLKSNRLERFVILNSVDLLRGNCLFYTLPA
jgi:hypothetical protein